MEGETIVETQETASLISRLRSNLNAATDEELRDIAKEAHSEIARREAERQREAMAKIKELAKAHGLNVAIDRPARKRGRPARKD